MEKLFSDAPTVLVQDPSRDTNYLIPRDRLPEFTASAQTWAALPDDTVTFVIPDEDLLLEEIPPYIRDAGVDPAVLIQHPTCETSYFFTPDQLRQFEMTIKPRPDDYGISFIMPVGMELIEELPAVMKAGLQAGESGARKMLWAKRNVAAGQQDG